MRKAIFIAIALTLIFCGVSYAEMSATGYTYDPQVGEMGTYIIAYNNTGADISSNNVVILDTTGGAAGTATIASGTTLGARIRTTATANSPLAIGVTDAVISNGSAGKVCVRGPHLCRVTTGVTGDGGALVAGATMSTFTTAGTLGIVNGAVTNGNDSAVIARLLSTTRYQDSSVAGREYIPTTLYWVWVGK